MKCLLSLIAAGSALLSAQVSQPRPTVVRAMGEAVVAVRPDEARLRLAVISTAGTTERALAKNAERATNVVAKLRDLLGQDAGIRTASYSLNKNYSDGYVANNTIEVHVSDPDIMGKLIDVATKAGASVIGGLDSSALDQQGARSEALKKATAQAQANAEAMAAALGLRSVRIASAEMSTLPLSPTPSLNAGTVGSKKRGRPPTPVVSGMVEVRVRVVVTLEVA